MTNDLTVREPKLPWLLPDEAVAELLATFKTFDEGHAVIINRAPTMVERQMLSRRGTEIELVLRPLGTSPQNFTVPNERGGTDTVSTKQYVRQMLALFFGGYTSMRSGDARPTIASYLHDLRAVPVWALERAFDDIKSGRVTVPDGRGGHKPLDPDFPPTSSRIYSVAMKHTAGLATEEHKIKRVLGPTKTDLAPVSDEERKLTLPRIQRMHQQAKAALSKVDPDEAAARAAAEARSAELLAKSNEHFAAAALAEYGELGVAPVVAAGFGVVSPELVLSNRAKGFAHEEPEPEHEGGGTEPPGTTRSNRGAASKARSKQKGDR